MKTDENICDICILSKSIKNDAFEEHVHMVALNE